MPQFAKDCWITMQQFLFCRMFSLFEIIYFITACPMFKLYATKHYGVWAFDVYLVMCIVGWWVVLWVNSKFIKRLPPVKFVD
jgi:hypothetical protein